MANWKFLVHVILEEYALSPRGTHGVSHWARVWENGLRLAETTGANVEVVKLFALFHDSRRLSEGSDFRHGRRGADFAAELRGDLFQLSDDLFELLYTACAEHTDGLTDGDITVQTCWDADRLDLARVGTFPTPDRLCTEPAKTLETRLWADQRAVARVVPDLVCHKWGVDQAR